MKFNQSAEQRETRQLFFRLIPANIATGSATQDTDGCVEGTYKCTVNKEGTGDYSITYNEPFTRKGTVIANAMHASSKLFCTIVSSGVSGCRIITHSDAGTATDPTEIHVMVVGFDAADQTS